MDELYVHLCEILSNSHFSSFHPLLIRFYDRLNSLHFYSSRSYHSFGVLDMHWLVFLKLHHDLLAFSSRLNLFGKFWVFLGRILRGIGWMLRLFELRNSPKNETIEFEELPKIWAKAGGGLTAITWTCRTYYYMYSHVPYSYWYM